MREKIDGDWRFYPGGESPFFGTAQEGIPVHLPHDFSIPQQRSPKARGGASNAFFPGGLGCYKKTLQVPEEWRGKEILLEFEGIYMNAEIRVNGQLIKRHIYGYTGFFCNITPHVKYGKENQISVNVNNDAMPNSRWYSGSGIYRPVWLEVRDPLHIASWGVFVTTPSVSAERSAVQVKTSLENRRGGAESVMLRSRLFDRDGTEAATTETVVSLAAGDETEVVQSLTATPAHLWSVDDPYLYTLCSEILQDGTVIQEQHTRVGIRSLSFDAETGFRLNGKELKLKGGCVHHDCGPLGAASYVRAEERKAELHKQNGYNAVRCAHNPPSTAFLDACDRLGLLVIDEAFDCWHEAKSPNDYGVYFDLLWKEDLRSMLLRDRNHPAVVMWSTGNEILERDGRSDGYALAQELADYVRSLDPTRAVTNALCPIPRINDRVDEQSLAEKGDQWAPLTEKFAEPLDVVGYNYLRYRYEYDGKKYPRRVILGTETYPAQALDYWEQVKHNSHVIGDFVWTSMDYLGEAGLGRVWYGEKTGFLGDYPWHTAFCGDFDLCGDKRPQSYYRDCVWGVSKAPYLAVYRPEHYGQTAGLTPWSWPDVVPCWDWPGFEGKPIQAEVYCASHEVELLLNGKSLGRKPAGKANRYRALFEAEYAPGELTAVAYDEQGTETARTVLKTAGKPVRIRLTADRATLNGEEDLAYVTAELVDENGNVAFHAENELFFSVCGAGTLAAVANSNPISEEMYVGNRRKAYHGKALALVRADFARGKIRLTAMTDGLPPADVSISIAE